MTDTKKLQLLLMELLGWHFYSRMNKSDFLEDILIDYKEANGLFYALSYHIDKESCIPTIYLENSYGMPIGEQTGCITEGYSASMELNRKHELVIDTIECEDDGNCDVAYALLNEAKLVACWNKRKLIYKTHEKGSYLPELEKGMDMAGFMENRRINYVSRALKPDCYLYYPANAKPLLYLQYATSIGVEHRLLDRLRYFTAEGRLFELEKEITSDGLLLKVKEGEQLQAVLKFSLGSLVVRFEVTFVSPDCNNSAFVFRLTLYAIITAINLNSLSIELEWDATTQKRSQHFIEQFEAYGSRIEESDKLNGGLLALDLLPSKLDDLKEKYRDIENICKIAVRENEN